jgi:hypothetical protein
MRAPTEAAYSFLSTVLGLDLLLLHDGRNQTFPCGLEVDHELELGRLLDCERGNDLRTVNLLTAKDIASSAAAARRPCA